MKIALGSLWTRKKEEQNPCEDHGLRMTTNTNTRRVLPVALHPSVKSSWAPGETSSEELYPQGKGRASLITVDVCSIYYRDLQWSHWWGCPGAPTAASTPWGCSCGCGEPCLQGPQLLLWTVLQNQDTCTYMGPKLLLLWAPPMVPVWNYSYHFQGRLCCPESHPQRPRLWLWPFIARGNRNRKSEDIRNK